ncbi:MAG: LamG domain-containing protein [Chitinophagaceae bacterium]|nr:LamG domain-containing protein [Chitinophagaceae bacterium]
MGTYSGPPSASDGLVLYLDAANSASYSGSGNTFYNLVNASIGGSIIGYASTPIDNTQIKSLTFDGSNDFISVGSLGSFYTQGTISFWMKSLDITANYRNPFATNYNGSNTNVLRFEQGEGLGAFKCWFGDPSGTIASLSYSSISANTWYNVVLTWNQSTTTVTGYMNGVLDVNNSSWVRWPTSFVNVGIGLGYNSRYFLGNIGQVSIYNRALSASEIFQNYNASKKRYFQEENIVTNGLILNIDPSKPSSYVGSGNAIYDLSGAGNTGTLANGPIFSGLNGGSLIFDGLEEYIDIPSISSISGDFTVALWFYSTAASENIYKRLIDFNYETGFWLGRYANTDTWGGGIIEPNGPYGIYLPFTNNQWHYLVSIRRGSTHILYGDGITSTVSNSVSTSILTSVNKLQIARQPGGANQYFAGRIAQVQLYNRALSAVEVEQNYNATKGRFGY